MITAENVKAGDLVKLKSGGCTMTVKRFVGPIAAEAMYVPAGVHCEWHDAIGAPHLQAYHPDMLEPAGEQL